MKTTIFKVSLLASGVVLLLSGCGSSPKLTCSMEEEGIKVEYTFTFNSKKTRITDLSTLIETEAPEDYDWAEIDLDDICEQEQIPGSCKATRNGNTLRITANLKGDEINEYTDGDVTEKTSYEDAKKFMEDMGVTCK